MIEHLPDTPGLTQADEAWLSHTAIAANIDAWRLAWMQWFKDPSVLTADELHRLGRVILEKRRMKTGR